MTILNTYFIHPKLTNLFFIFNIFFANSFSNLFFHKMIFEMADRSKAVSLSQNIHLFFF